MFPDSLCWFSVSNSRFWVFTFHDKYIVMQVHKNMMNTNPISSPNHPKLPIKSITIRAVMLVTAVMIVYYEFVIVHFFRNMLVFIYDY